MLIVTSQTKILRFFKTQLAGCHFMETSGLTMKVNLYFHLGEKHLTTITEFDRSKRRYRASYKSTMVLRKLLRTKGYLVDFENPKQPFYSIDLQMVRIIDDNNNFDYSLIVGASP